MSSAAFRSTDEFRSVMDRIFTMMGEDAEMGPRLRAAHVATRYRFPDVDLVVNVRSTHEDEPGNLLWVWSDDVDWPAQIRMEMSSETANRYFQGKESIALAVARRRIKTTGDLKAALALIPVTKPIYAAYSAWVDAELPHLRV